jgi:hypothetical protein
MIACPLLLAVADGIKQRSCHRFHRIVLKGFSVFIRGHDASSGNEFPPPMPQRNNPCGQGMPEPAAP